jgi:hypothetical protein
VVAMSELPTPLVVSRRVDVVTRKTSHPDSNQTRQALSSQASSNPNKTTENEVPNQSGCRHIAVL